MICAGIFFIGHSGNGFVEAFYEPAKVTRLLKPYLHGIPDGVQLGQRGVSVSPIGLERAGDGIGANSMAG